jgi:hypothetical protein
MHSLSIATTPAKRIPAFSAWVALPWQLIIFLASLIAVSPAHSAIVYSQASDSPDKAKLINSSATNPDGSDQDVTTYDNFKLSKSARITGVSWRGASTDVASAGFIISIYASQGNPTGLAELSNPLAVINETGKANEKAVGKNLADYSAAFSQPVELIAGTQYWISIVSIRNFPSSWGWSSASGGDGRSIQSYSEFKILPAPNDRAFALSDDNLEPIK